MRLFDRLDARQKLIAAYVLVVVAAAGALLAVFPEQWCGIGVMSLVGIAAAWSFAQLGSRRLRRRVHELREITDAISSGRLQDQLATWPKDDFCKLTQSVDRLATQLRQIIAERDRLQQRLSRSERLAVIGELAATVAHEINNPLDGLQNSVRILRRHPENLDQSRRLLDMMEIGLDRIEKTVRRLLSMSHDEPIQPVPTRLDRVIDDAVFFVQPRLHRYHVEYVCQWPPVPIIVQADAVHLAQAVVNLMLNAADAMQNGGTLVVRAGLSEDGGRAWFEVIDNGAGIPDEHLPHIFEPFYSTKSKGYGTGLGLAIVKRIVEAHQGRVEVRTEAGKGSRFRVELLAVKADLSADFIRELPQVSTEPSCDAAESMTGVHAG